MAKFQKGVPRVKGAGRKAGTPNKTTSECKEAISELIAGNMAKMQTWLDKVAEDDPARAFELLIKMMEFSVPKLSRTVFKQDEKQGSLPAKIIIEHVSSPT